ncbi:TlpA family protein disulfide reductase [Telmatobacter bradus]|uniref:TlpA family protein disulfide reductase n=1 Tax=Telmatobacter bradus TaxID=474953 RepID=UPI003B42B967
MRFPRALPFLLSLPLVAFTACNRGAHPSQMGKPAPDFTISDGQTSVHLANYRGQVVLLNFWATWCGPCVEEMPSLLQLHHQLPGVAIVAVSVDEDADAYKSFLSRRHVDLITVRDPQEKAAGLFHTDMWPETYVIDRQGMIRRKFIGAQDWNSPEIVRYLKTL